MTVIQERRDVLISPRLRWCHHITPVRDFGLGDLEARESVLIFKICNDCQDCRRFFMNLFQRRASKHYAEIKNVRLDMKNDRIVIRTDDPRDLFWKLVLISQMPPGLEREEVFSMFGGLDRTQSPVVSRESENLLESNDLDLVRLFGVSPMSIIIFIIFILLLIAMLSR